LKEFAPDGQVIAEWGGDEAPLDPFAPKPHGTVAADAVGNIYVVDVNPTSGAGGVWYWSRAEALAMRVRRSTTIILRLLAAAQTTDETAGGASVDDLLAQRSADISLLMEIDPQVADRVLGESTSTSLRRFAGARAGVETEVSGLEGVVRLLIGDGFGPDGPVSYESYSMDRSAAERPGYLQIYAEPTVLRGLQLNAAAAVDGYRIDERVLVRASRAQEP